MVTLRSEIPPELLDDVRDELDITWATDEATENRLRGHVAAGMVYLNGKYGAPADYEADGLPRTLLMQYVRYARDSALDVFENNYRSMILAMQNEGRLSRYVESTQQTQ